MGIPIALDLPSMPLQDVIDIETIDRYRAELQKQKGA